MKSLLAAAPSREAIIAEFRSSDGYKKDIVTARIAAVDTYKGSEDFEEELKAAMERGIEEFKNSISYATELTGIRNAAVSEYRRSTSFKDVVGAEAGKLSMQIVECCREYLKDDMRRPTHEFGEFFVNFVRRQKDGASSKVSSGVSGAHSSMA